MTVTDILDELTWRGLIAQSTDPDALRKALDAGPVTFYCGLRPDRAQPAHRQPRAAPHRCAGSSRPATRRSAWSAAPPA